MGLRRIEVAWFDGWHRVLDDALRELPEADACPGELYAALFENPGGGRKRAALVTRQGMPIAVAGLRQTGRWRWEPMTQWIIPGLVFPAKPEDLMPALEALRTDISVAWWRMPTAPPPGRGVRNLESTPVYRMRCSADYEQYWRQTKHFKTVQNKRNRCRGFTLAVNDPGAAEWVIKNWSAKWRGDASADLSLSDRILAATYLEGQGKHYTLMLLDGDKPVGGATQTVHGRDLVAGVIYRHPDYERHGIGDRLIDLVFAFAAERGFETLDIGGGHEYKKHWAPQDGERWQFRVCPAWRHGASSLLNRASALRRRLRLVR